MISSGPLPPHPGAIPQRDFSGAGFWRLENGQSLLEVHNMSGGQIRRTEQPTVAFVLSLLAGLWMLAFGSMMGGFGWRGMMGGQGMSGWMWGQGTPRVGAWWPWFSTFAGIVVLVGAVMLYVKPEQRQSWSVVILIASALNFFVGMGGLLAGTLGVVGGILALSAKD
jgi:hypothetical protein